jgi:hypothetical protein
MVECGSSDPVTGISSLEQTSLHLFTLGWKQMQFAKHVLFGMLNDGRNQELIMIIVKIFLCALLAPS